MPFTIHIVYKYIQLLPSGACSFTVVPGSGVSLHGPVDRPSLQYRAVEEYSITLLEDVH